VTVCTTNLQNERSDLAVPIDRPVDVDGVKVYYEPTNLSRYWGYSSRLRQRIKVEVPRSDVVLVHAHFQYANWIGARLARQHRMPYVVFPHSSLVRHSLNSSHRWLKRFYLTVLERRNLRNALFIAFNAPEEQAASLYSDRGRVVPNGIDPDDFVRRPPLGAARADRPELKDKVVLLFLGRIDIHQKGLDHLIAALALVHQDHPNIHLVVAGPDEMGGLQKLEKLLVANHLNHAVTFAGLVTGDAKTSLLQDCDAFVMSSRYEGASIALLEALHFSLPILVTNRVGLQREIAETGAGLVVEPTVDGIAHGIRKLTDPHVRRSFNNLGTELIQRKFTWDAIAAELIRMIESSL